MIKTKLKPHVHKVKGAKNYALYDLMKGVFYSIEPEGDVAELKKSLKEAGLIIETEGTVPNKITVDLANEKTYVQLRELQIRINGRGEHNCWERQKVDQEKRTIDEKIIRLLKRELNVIPLRKLRIEAETEEPGKIALALGVLQFKKAKLYVENGIKKDNLERYRKICIDKKAELTIIEDNKRDIRCIHVDTYYFFYNQHFNPCLGHQIAVDCGGEIKTCLWSNEVLGNIEKDNLKDLIVSGTFDQYWELPKDEIDVCMDCELRYACLDCRISGIDSLTGKPSYCSYDPYKGLPFIPGP